jgi:tRNA dimethylallyltransferase
LISGPVVVVICGPTAAGKSELGVAFARSIGGEVINADSMQLYRGMDIGTAKLPSAERAGVPHHLLDVWEVTRTASVAEYQQETRAVVDRLLASGRTPILVGGSGLYLRAVLEDFEFPGTRPEVRSRLEAELLIVGPAVLHERLAGLDPASAARILPGNGRRIVRALEVVEITGAPFRAELPEPSPVYQAVHLGLDTDPDLLDTRIAQRVTTMWEQGLVEEVRSLEAVGLREGLTASRALGYAQVLRMFDGEIDDAEARRLTVQATRRFVRRQRSWFRRDRRISWLNSGQTGLPELLNAALAAVGEGPAGTAVPRTIEE